MRGSFSKTNSPIRAYQAIGATWFLRGQQKHIPTSGCHMAATGPVLVHDAEHATTATFAVFLQTVCATFSRQQIQLVADNAKIRQAKALQPYLAEHPA